MNHFIFKSFIFKVRLPKPNLYLYDAHAMKYYFEKRKILLVGATGLIGTELYNLFKEEGHTIKILSTNKSYVEENDYAYYWNIEEGVVDEAAIEGAEVMVNLAGASIAGGLWTEKRKELIYSSRIEGTKLLFETCKRINKRFKFYIGASATGFYGPNNTTTPKKESDPAGTDFLAHVCADWEKEHKKFDAISEIYVIARISNVFSPKGGFLLPFIKLSQYGLRIYFGKHKYYFSWIHVEDVARFISAVLYMDLEGTYNISVGETYWLELQNDIYDEFGDQIIRFGIPQWVLKKVLGEMSGLLLNGNYVDGNRLEDFGFMIKHVELDLILRDIHREL